MFWFLATKARKKFPPPFLCYRRLTDIDKFVSRVWRYEFVAVRKLGTKDLKSLYWEIDRNLVADGGQVVPMPMEGFPHDVLVVTKDGQRCLLNRSFCDKKMSKKEKDFLRERKKFLSSDVLHTRYDASSRLPEHRHCKNKNFMKPKLSYCWGIFGKDPSEIFWKINFSNRRTWTCRLWLDALFCTRYRDRNLEVFEA